MLWWSVVTSALQDAPDKAVTSGKPAVVDVVSAINGIAPQAWTPSSHLQASGGAPLHPDHGAGSLAGAGAMHCPSAVPHWQMADERRPCGAELFARTTAMC
jgi:hypothetical protein